MLFQTLKRYIRKTLPAIIFLSVFVYSQSYQDISIKISYPWQLEIAKKSNKTILDYFYLLPGGFIDCDSTHHHYPTFTERKKLITFVNEKNGYIESLTLQQMALFKNRIDSIDIIVLQTGKSGAGCSCGAINDAFQFIPEKNMWISRTELFPPGYKHEEIYNNYSDFNILPFFRLPKKGLTIEIADESKHDSVIGSLRWNGERFIVQTKIKMPK